MLCVWGSFEKLFVMIVPFVDLQEFTFERKFVVKKMAVLRKRNVIFHYIIVCSLPCNLLTKFDKSCASWLIVNHHELRWQNGAVQWRYVWLHRLWLVPKMMTFSYTSRDILKTKMVEEHESDARNNNHRDIGCRLRKHRNIE